MATLSQRALTQAIEKSMWEIARQYEGDEAFYFCDEADVKCRLFCCIQRNLKDPRLVHAEWPAASRSGFLDLVVWRPDKKDEAADWWGKSRRVMMKQVPDLLFAGIEIDCMGGHCSKASRFTTYRQLHENPDIQKLIEGTGCTFKYGYFLVFWDENALSVYSKTAKRMSDRFAGLRAKHGLRSLCVSREGVVFAHGLTAQ